MTNKKRGGLGSGLGALLPAQPSLREVAVTAIRPNPQQPREQFDQQALADLARSIQEHGVLQPLLVTMRDDGDYELIAGERRWRAATQAGLSTVPVIVKEVTTQGLLELAIIENVQRADLNPIEEARAYQALKDDFGLSDLRIAELVGQKKRETIANTRRLLSLSAMAQQALLDGKISAGHGRALLMIRLADTEREQQEQELALKRTIAEGLSVRQLEQLAQDVSAGGNIVQAELRPDPKLPDSSQKLPSSTRSNQASKVGVRQSAEDDQIVAQLEQALATRVLLQRGERESRLVIMFYDDEQLQGLYDRLTNNQ